jgi:hypothetical protein
VDLRTQLQRFLPHAAVAAVVVWMLLRYGGAWTARLAQRIAAADRGRFLAAAIALTLATRLVLVPVIHPAYDADVREYCEKAAAIATDGDPRAQETRADGTRFYRTLGYSLPLAGWYRVTGMPQTPEGRTRSAQAFNLLAACGVAALLVALGRALGRETAGRVAALAYATFLPAVVFALVPYSETWATLLLVASVLAFEKTRRAEGAAAVGFGAALGLLQGLLLITRTEFALLPLAAAAWLVAERRTKALAPIAAGLALLCVPFAVNHQMRDGYPGHLRTSVQGGLILYYGNNPIAVNGYGNATPAVVSHVRTLYDADPTGGLARDEAVAWIEAHPFLVAANAPKKLYHLWLGEPQGFTWHIGAGRGSGTNRVLADLLRHAAWIQSLALLGLGVEGLLVRGGPFGFWIAVAAVHAATWCALAASTRNRYPVEPLLMIAAAAWIESRRPDASG